MSPEMILLIISLIGNIGIIFKKIRVIWTPCFIIDCRSGNTEESVEQAVEPNEANVFKRAITKLTPRKFRNTQAQTDSPV